MVVSVQDLQQIVEAVWLPTLEMSARGTPIASPADIQGISCRLEITGDWNGCVVVGCDQELLDVAASRMFDTVSVTDRDCQDALSELTNMIGGTVKSLLPGSCVLGLPTVDHSGEMPDEKAFDSLSVLECQDHLMCVAVTFNRQSALPHSHLHISPTSTTMR